MDGVRGDVPEEWKIVRLKHELRETYTKDENVLRMIVRLARRGITGEKAEWVARAVHNVKGWAGTPVAFDDIGRHRPAGSKERDIATAREVLEKCKAVLDERKLS